MLFLILLKMVRLTSEELHPKYVSNDRLPFFFGVMSQIISRLIRNVKLLAVSLTADFPFQVITRYWLPKNRSS